MRHLAHMHEIALAYERAPQHLLAGWRAVMNAEHHHKRTPQAKATTLARKRARAVKYATPTPTNRRKASA